MRLIFPLLLLSVLPAAADDIPVITIATPPGQMKYDRPVIRAKPGAQVKIVFKNGDAMPHNIVFCHPKDDGSNDRGMEVAQEAWKLAEKGEAAGWLPQHPRIWAHSKMVGAHAADEFLLRVPDKPGVYPYVCTFPGHAMAMNGELRVLAEGPGFSELNYKLYMGDWTKLPDFDALPPHRSGPLAEKKLDLKLEGMSEHFGVRFEGKLEAPGDGLYFFKLASDDGARLSLDGRAVIDNDGVHASGDVRQAGVRLKKGPHTVRVDYFEQTAHEEIYLAWAGPGFSDTVLSAWEHPSHSGDAAEAREPRGQGIPLAPQNGEAVIHRNSIEGCGPRGIAVGYPNGVNICFDASQMSQVLMWRGAFLDVKPHWTDRGGGKVAPLGFGILRLHDGPGMAVLTGPDAPWPARAERAEGIRFMGYSLDAKRFPTFRYRLGDVSVEEHYELAGAYATEDEQFTRVLRFNGSAPAGLSLRIATGGMREDSGGWRHGGGVHFTVTGGTARLRGGNELIVAPAFTEGAAEVRIGARWIP